MSDLQWLLVGFRAERFTGARRPIAAALPKCAIEKLPLHCRRQAPRAGPLALNSFE